MEAGPNIERDSPEGVFVGSVSSCPGKCFVQRVYQHRWQRQAGGNGVAVNLRTTSEI